MNTRLQARRLFYFLIPSIVINGGFWIISSNQTVPGALISVAIGLGLYIAILPLFDRISLPPKTPTHQNITRE